MSFLFSQSIWCSLTIWCSFLGKVVLRLRPLLLAALWLDQSMINSVPILLITQVFSVWLFVWIIFWFFHLFDLACLRDVPFRKRLFPASSKHWVNPGTSSSQWLTPLFCFDSDQFFVWRSSFELAFFWPIRFCLFMWCSVQKEAVPRLLPVIGEPRWLEQSMNNAVLILLICFVLVTVIIWMCFWFLLPFGFVCLREVPFGKSLFRGSSQ